MVRAQAEAFDELLRTILAKRSELSADLGHLRRQLGLGPDDTAATIESELLAIDGALYDRLIATLEQSPGAADQRSSRCLRRIKAATTPSRSGDDGNERQIRRTWNARCSGARKRGGEVPLNGASSPLGLPMFRTVRMACIGDALACADAAGSMADRVESSHAPYAMAQKQSLAPECCPGRPSGDPW